MEGNMWIWIVAAVVVLILIATYNSLVRKRNDVDNAFACIDTQLKKRFDLIPNLVGTVKTYMQHERETLTQIAELRTKAMSPGISPDELVKYGDQASGLLRKIMVQVENYPDLKANENFMHLQRTLNEVEEQLSAARRAYNGAVTEYNNAIQTFPTNLLAGIFGFRQRQLFAATEEERQNPNVSNLFK